jgi:hypothetical protein
MDENETAILYRPVGPEELALIRQSAFRAFPPRLPEAGGSPYQEYWIPAEELTEFNANIVGFIEVIAEFHAESSS